METKYIVIGLLVIAAFSVLRVVSQLRGVARKNRRVDWDEHFIHGLRKAGVNTFEEHTVDFFFTVPVREGSETLAAALRAEGYKVDVQHDPATGRFSVHGQRGMRLIVPEMRELTAKLNALAAEHGGQYDNWAVVMRKS